MELLIPSEAVSAKRTKLAVISTHPIQYHSAWYRAMASHPELDLRVYYCHQATPQEQANAGFGVEFDWDVPLLEGYPVYLPEERGPFARSRERSADLIHLRLRKSFDGANTTPCW